MGETSVPLMIAILFVQCASDSHAVVVSWWCCGALTGSQERFEAELASLRSKLHDFSAGENSQVGETGGETKMHNEDVATDGSNGALRDKEKPSETEIKNGGMSHRLDEVLHKELSLFCDQLTCSTAGDVSQEQETNSRHKVLDATLEHCPGDERDSGAIEGNGGSQKGDDDAKFVEGNSDAKLQKEVEKLRQRLAGVILPLMSSAEGKKWCYFRYSN